MAAFAAFAALSLGGARGAAADAGAGVEGGAPSRDAGPEVDAGPASADAGSGSSAGDAAQSAPAFLGLACDGALCDTTNSAEAGGSCTAARAGGGPGAPGWPVAVAAIVAAGMTRRRSPRGAERARQSR